MNEEKDRLLVPYKLLSYNKELNYNYIKSYQTLIIKPHNHTFASQQNFHYHRWYRLGHESVQFHLQVGWYS